MRISLFEQRLIILHVYDVQQWKVVLSRPVYKFSVDNLQDGRDYA